MTQPTAVILAAGMSSRLRPLCDDRPKCLLPLGDRTILDWQVQALQAIGVRDIVMVVGYLKDLIQKHIADHYPALSVQFVENPLYQSTNTLFSLRQALEIATGDFYYLNADVVFDREILVRLASEVDGGYLAVDRKQCRDEEVKVIVEAGQVTQIGKHLNSALCFGEFIGVGKFSGEFADRFRSNVHAEARPGNEMAFFEHALDTLSDKDGLRAVDVTGLPCVEIDFPEDYTYAVTEVLSRLTMER
ncbi:phosphocholine cytidylyltransferase family protein [Alicyclobacillus acidiphilus]|uniref:phosphocholine cytidylyltransferase family protein n=1 Tax=Alicyclobacillus acidiphilus TaxID=182455 RepID=UPI0008378881|nr:phosphocholine cytidylyltransferase family protein [Alicyclobacillus acidiphilus]